MNPFPSSGRFRKKLADKLYNTTGPDDFAILSIGDKNKYIAECLLKKLQKNQIGYSIIVKDPDFMSLLFTHCSDEAVEALAAHELSLTLHATRSIAARPNSQEVVRVPPVFAIDRIFNVALRPRADRV